MATDAAGLATKFMSHVSPEPMSGCWLWLGQVNDHGYPYFRVFTKRENKNHRAHTYWNNNKRCCRICRWVQQWLRRHLDSAEAR